MGRTKVLLAAQRMRFCAGSHICTLQLLVLELLVLSLTWRNHNNRQGKACTSNYLLVCTEHCFEPLITLELLVPRLIYACASLLVALYTNRL